MTPHSANSSAREKLIEHLFVGDLLRHLWIRGIHDVEFLRAAVDHSGYDIVIECCGILRHVQLRASARNAKTARQKVHQRLMTKPSGCVIWIQFDRLTLELGPFLWFGASPGLPLPSLEGFPIGKHSKANALEVKAERPNIRVVNKGHFVYVHSMSELVKLLFGDLVNETLKEN